jgi:hypothetical protein
MSGLFFSSASASLVLFIAKGLDKRLALEVGGLLHF